MDIRAKLTVFGVILGLLATLIGNVFGWGWSAGVWVFLVLTIAATVAIHSETYRPRLQRLFAPGRAGSLYRRFMIRIARWPRDWRMYDWALRLAVIYPTTIPVLLWIYPGMAATLGGVEIIPPPSAWWQQAALIGAIAMMVVAGVKLASATAKGSMRKFLLWLIFFFAAVAIAGAVVGAVAGAFAVAIAGVFAIAGAVVGAVAGAFAVVGAVAVAVAAAVEYYAQRGYGARAYSLYTLAVLLGLAGVLVTIDWTEIDSDVSVIFLFLGLLPLLNAIFDYASYALTWTLLRKGVRHPGTALPWGLFDLAAAGVLFLISGAAMVIAVAGANRLAGVELYPLARLFHDIRLAPTEYIWLYAMLFSTILPTALHAGVGLFSIGTWLTPTMRRGLSRLIASDDPVHATAAPLLIGLYWTACLLIPFALGWGIYLIIAHWHPHPLGWYLTWLEYIACWMGPASCPA